MKIVVCLIGAMLVAFAPDHAGLSDAGRMSMAIVLLASGLWVTEAIPGFAVALLVIGLQVVTLGGSTTFSIASDDPSAWQTFTRPWAAAPMWLFFAGLMMARAAERAGIAAWFADIALEWSRGDGRRTLWAVMAITFAFSMFISNTAMAALMIGVLGTFFARLGDDEAGRNARSALLMGVVFSANLGGMGTIVGTPPNAVAVGLLAPLANVTFGAWMLYGLPPALLLVALVALASGRSMQSIALAGGIVPNEVAASRMLTQTQTAMVVAVFAVTVLLWMTEPLHGLPNAVVAFLPIVVLTSSRILRVEDVRALPWDVLLLIAGGLSLGAGVLESGLAHWLVRQFTVDDVPLWMMALVLAYATSLLSNFMSNTAAANLMLPVAITLGLDWGGPAAAVEFAVPVALAASSAMCLPVSTPPNALAFSTGFVSATRLLRGGIAIGLLAPPLAVGWCMLVTQLNLQLR